MFSATTILKFRNVGHKYIHFWDEMYHALVARNMMKHLLKPTLFENPYLPYDYRGWWQGNHVWLHKPPYAMWQIATSYRLLGVNTFALRLPSVIMSCLSVFITYLIGLELHSKKAGFVAATLQALNPLIMLLIHGYMFSDHINIALIFWVELSCYLLIRGVKTGKVKYYIWSGVGQGFGYLSKSYLCLVAFGIACAIYILSRIGFLKSYRENLKIKSILIQITFSILTVAPWIIFCLVRYTKEFIFENRMILAHLNTEVEIWERAWDFHLFQYMPTHYPHLFLLIFTSFFFLLYFAFRDRELCDWYVISWILVVIIPLSISTSKVPAGTDIAIPALVLCFSVVWLKIVRRREKGATIGLFSIVFSLFFLLEWPLHLCDKLKKPVILYLSGITELKKAAPTLYSSSWILYQFLCCLAVFTIFFLIYIGFRLLRRPLWSERYINTLKIMASIMIAVLIFPLASESVKVSERKLPPDNFEDVGNYIRENLPDNSAFILESPERFDYYYLMFHADRSVYRLGANNNAVWLPRDSSTLSWTDYVFEFDYMLYNRVNLLAFNYRYVDNENFYRFNPSLYADVVSWHFRRNGHWGPDCDISELLFTREKIWYRVQITVKGKYHNLKIKRASDLLPFEEIEPYIDVEDESMSYGTIGVLGRGYVDNLVVYKSGIENGKPSLLFQENFEKEKLETMPSRWNLLGSDDSGFKAKTVKDPLNKKNKVLFIDSPSDWKWQAETIKRNGGVPYLGI